MLQLRDAQNQVVTLQATQVQSDKDKADLQARVDLLGGQVKALTDQAAADKASTDRAIADLKAQVSDETGQIGRLTDGLKQWKDAYNQVAQLAAAKEAARAQLALQAALLQRTVDDRETKNLALYSVGSEILTRYEKFGLGDALAAKEPFTGVTRVKLENLVQEYKNKLLDQAITSGQAPAAAPPEALPASPADALPAATPNAPAAGNPEKIKASSTARPALRALRTPFKTAMACSLLFRGVRQDAEGNVLRAALFPSAPAFDRRRVLLALACGGLLALSATAHAGNSLRNGAMSGQGSAGSAAATSQTASAATTATTQSAQTNILAQHAQASLTHSIQALQALQAAQAAARTTALAAPSTVPNGLVVGGLVPGLQGTDAADPATTATTASRHGQRERHGFRYACGEHGTHSPAERGRQQPDNRFRHRHGRDDHHGWNDHAAHGVGVATTVAPGSTISLTNGGTVSFAAASGWQFPPPWPPTRCRLRGRASGG